MNHNDVCHAWANKIKPSATGCNVFFERDTIYSYGYHFPMARHVSVKGEDIVLFTTKGYSVSTSKHLSYAGRACSHLDVIHVENVMADNKHSHLRNLDNMNKEFEELEGAMNRAIKYKSHHARRRLGLAQNIQQYMRLFLPRHKFKLNIEELQEKYKELEADFEIQEARREAEREKRNAKQIALWIEGKIKHCPHTQFIRLRINDEEIQTSWGAGVPITDAVRLFELCKICRSNCRSMDSFTHKVGSFVPSSINTSGDAVVGCHTLKFEEMQRIEEQLKTKV